MSVAPHGDVRCEAANDIIGGLFVEDEGRPGQRFYPVDKVRSYLARDRVAWLFQCPCTNCRREFGFFRSNMSPADFADRIVGPENEPDSRPDPYKTAFSLFALLTYIKHPMLIIGFMWTNTSDYHLETRVSNTFSRENLRNIYCQDFAARDAQRFARFASDFIQFLPQFAIPRMNSGVYSHYSSDTILPFINETTIGDIGPDGSVIEEGANGRVYAFEIYEEYREFPHASQCKKFARKELHSNSAIAFHLEHDSLNVANTLHDNHIIQMIKGYKHGKTFNLIFPRAKTNLDHLLRQPAQDYSDTLQGPVETHPAWAQLLGIATALGKIGGPQGTDSIFGQRSQQQYLGVHFDLKPANILIDDQGNWLISDFGQSFFRLSGGSSSQVPNGGGTHAYAPPEIENEDVTARFSRRYDVWSLGCIFLEVVTFVIFGYDGLNGCEQKEGLDQVRYTSFQTRDGILRTDPGFFYKDGHGKYKIKEEIIDFMETIRSADKLQQVPKGEVFIRSVLELITEMLSPEAETRVEIGEVIRRLGSAINDAIDIPRSQDIAILPLEGERPVGEPELSLVRIWLSNNTLVPQWDSGSLHCFEDADHNLRFVTTSNNHSLQNCLERATVVLVPRYAWFQKFTGHISEKAIYLSKTSATKFHQYHGLIFSFSDREHAKLVQSKLTGHRIEENFPVENIKCHSFSSWENLKSQLSFRRGEKDITNLGAGRIQLWTEVHDYMSTHIRQNSVPVESSSLRPVRTMPHQRKGYRGVPLRRMVIYVHATNSIITVPLGKNWHELLGQPQDQLKSLRFGPRDPNSDPSFKASTFRPVDLDDPECFPGIPLSHKTLRDTEASNVFECDSMVLTFARQDDAVKFSGTYKRMRTSWKSETEALERQPGYTPALFNYDRDTRPSTSKSKGKSEPPLRPKEKHKSMPWNLFRPSISHSHFSLGTQMSGALPVIEGKKWRPDAHHGGSRGGWAGRDPNNSSKTSTKTTPRHSIED